MMLDKKLNKLLEEKKEHIDFLIRLLEEMKKGKNKSFELELGYKALYVIETKIKFIEELKGE